jgi:hypothetical protein
LRMKRHDFALDEPPDRFPENMVFLAENRSLDHDWTPAANLVM